MTAPTRSDSCGEIDCRPLARDGRLRPVKAIRHPIPASVLVLVVALLTGCARFHDRPMTAEKTSADFHTRTLADPGLKAFLETNLPTPVVTWPLTSWNFNSLALAAFYFHPDLDVARAKWGVTRSGQVTAGERPNPTVSFAPGYNSTVGPPWILGLSFDLPIETAGKRGHRIAHAGHLSAAARLNIATVAWQVRSRVRRSLLELEAAREMESLLTRQQEAQAAIVKLLEGQLAAGAVSPFEVTQARVAQDTTRLALHDAERQAAEARAQLADALGVPSAALDGVSLSFDRAPLPPLPTPDVRRQALLNRADLRGALAEYAAAQAALQLEVSKQYPDLHLGPGYQLDQTANKWTLGLSVTLPIFNQNQGAIAEAEARRVESAAHFTALQAHVLGELDRATAGYRALLAKSATADALLARLQKQEQSTQEMVAAGGLPRLALLTAQLELNTGRLAQLDTQLKTRQALAALEDIVQIPLPPAGGDATSVPLSAPLVESSPRTAKEQP